MPDRIIIFQEPIERYARSLDEMAELIRDTVRHEIGHYFGIGEDRLRQIEYERTHRRHRGQRG
jgi:predicted Zn-dependent protease with MMP-like domain